MITLKTFPAGFGEQSYSPFCVKAIWLLNASGRDWVRQDLNDPRKMPHGKLPVIDVDEVQISGSDAIATYLSEQGLDLWQGATSQDCAKGHAQIRMAEEHLYFQIVMDRWGNDAVWPIIQKVYFHEIPKLLRGFVAGKLRKDLLTAMNSHGIGRLSPAERFAKAEADLTAIASLLAEQPYLLGSFATLPDFAVAAMICGAAANPVATKLATHVRDDATLMAYADRMKAQFDTKSAT